MAFTPNTPAKSDSTRAVPAKPIARGEGLESPRSVHC